MPNTAPDPKTRRPRFRRLAEPPAFRVTEGDIAIVREIYRHRFLRSTQIAKLVDRSLDRTNDRLSLLFHAGYIDRPRAQTRTCRCQTESSPVRPKLALMVRWMPQPGSLGRQ